MNALAALNRARAAWERSQPQMFLDLWPEGLDEAHEPTGPHLSGCVGDAAVGLVELPGSIPPEVGGLTPSGAEPETAGSRSSGELGLSAARESAPEHTIRPPLRPTVADSPRPEGQIGGESK